jgi:hypothetical protein
MFVIENKILNNLIRNSVSIKKNLWKEEIETFVRNSEYLPENAKKELENKLRLEVLLFWEYKKFEKTKIKKVKKLNLDLNFIISKYRKYAFKKWEKLANLENNPEEILKKL